MTAPYNGGSVITSYIIEIRHFDGAYFSEYKATCDGSQASIVSSLLCKIPLSALRVPPYSLTWGNLIYARVAATNVKGTSVFSEINAGTQMLTKPDAPFNLANDINRSSGKTITIVWNNGAEDGGTPVIDYIVSYDSGLGTNVFTVLASAVTTQSYSVTQVTPGKTYVFKVQSRNAFGPSLFSD